MKNFSSSIRESAIDIYRGNKKIEDDTMRKFFYYSKNYENVTRLNLKDSEKGQSGME